uniref:Uncharacterized protein n=1 Tax=Oryza nivara TaxID=4536 RepID=A0A0E0I7B9_ORYNI
MFGDPVHWVLILPLASADSSELRRGGFCGQYAVLLLLQGARGEGGDGGAQERPGHPRHAPLRRPIPQHQAREHSGCRPGQVPAHAIRAKLLHQGIGGAVRVASPGWRRH